MSVVSTARARVTDVVNLFATPLKASHYVELVNPLWSSHKLQARVEGVWDETKDSRTITLRPSRNWRRHRADQHVRLGVPIDGRRFTATPSTDRHFSGGQLDEFCPDWRQREVWACGPQSLLESVEEHFATAGRAGAVHIERFRAPMADIPDDAAGGFCGHFPDGVHLFGKEVVEDETRAGWYLRQLLGSANIAGGPRFHVLAGNLSHQIEHHLFPDMPSSRYQQVAPRVRALCARYGLPYNSAPLRRQFGTTTRKIWRYALPGGKDTVSEAPALRAA